MALTDVTIRKLKPRDTAYKAFDRDSLYLAVSPTGLKTWRYDYTFGGKRKTLTIGRYPDIGLAAARREQVAAKENIASGLDPSEVKRDGRAQLVMEQARAGDRAASERFADVGEDYLDWLKGKEPPLAPPTITKKEWIVRDIAGSVLGDRRMRDIKPSDVLEILRSLEAKKQLETAKRTRSTLSALFRFAIWAEKAEVDPVAPLRGAVAAPVPANHAAITDEKAFGDLLATVGDYSGWYSVKMGLLFIAFTFCRPGEARLAQWSEFDLAGKLWTIPAERMKMRREHKVPLSSQAMGILIRARQIDPHSPLVFPSVRSNRKPLSDNALNAALRRMGYTKDEMVAHGFRSSASTILNERGFDAEIVEAQLSHMSADRIKRIYDRGERWDQRVRLMRDWGRICERLMLA